MSWNPIGIFHLTLFDLSAIFDTVGIPSLMKLSLVSVGLLPSLWHYTFLIFLPISLATTLWGGHLLFLCSSFKYWSFSRLLPGLLHWWSIAAQQTISKPTGLRIEYIYIFKNKIVNILFAHHSVGQQVRAGLGKWSWPLCHSAALT